MQWRWLAWFSHKVGINEWWQEPCLKTREGYRNQSWPLPWGQDPFLHFLLYAKWGSALGLGDREIRVLFSKESSFFFKFFGVGVIRFKRKFLLKENYSLLSSKEISLGGTWNRWLRLLNTTFCLLPCFTSSVSAYSKMLLLRKELVAKLMRCLRPKLPYSFFLNKASIAKLNWCWNGYWLETFSFWLMLKAALFSIKWNKPFEVHFNNMYQEL